MTLPKRILVSVVIVDLVLGVWILISKGMEYLVFPIIIFFPIGVAVALSVGARFRPEWSKYKDLWVWAAAYIAAFCVWQMVIYWGIIPLSVKMKIYPFRTLMDDKVLLHMFILCPPLAVLPLVYMLRRRHAA